MAFLSELKRRNVIRAGMVWLALSWLLVAMCALLFPALGLPMAALRWMIQALALALLPLLFLAWRFELTRNGLQVDRGPDADNPQRAITARRLDQLAVVLILAASSLSLLRQFIVEAGPKPGTPEIVAPVVEAPSPPRRPAGPVDPHSLAVLPFTNMSPSNEDAYFAEGLAEELLNVLARVKGLKVTSRTSSFAFRDQSLETREIAAQLGVANLLEGSVRRDGDKVRITVQLIDASADRPVWSETYDRSLEDIFRVQEEISQAIANALTDSLGVRQVQVQVTAATTNLQAYETYLRGRQLFAQRGANLPAARELLQQAVELDPQFADAWATLAGTWYVWRSYAAEPEGISTLAQAQMAADRALALQPGHPGALAVSARVAADRGDRLRSIELIAKALAGEPNNANTWLWQGLGHFETGHLRDAHASFLRAQQLDPLSGLQLGWLGITTALHGDRSRGIDLLQKAHAVGWRGPASRALLFIALGSSVRDDDGDIIQAYLDWLHDDDTMPAEQRKLARSLAAALSDPSQLAQAQQQLKLAVAEAPELGWSALLQLFGQTDAAIEQSLRSDPGYAQALLFSLWYPNFRSFRQHPGFLLFAEQQGLTAYWQKLGPPDGCSLQTEPVRHLECEQ